MQKKEKVMLKIYFPPEIKFILQFDYTSNNTIQDLKVACVKELFSLFQNAPACVSELPTSYDPLYYSLKDLGNSFLNENDLVKDIIINNHEIQLVLEQKIQPFEKLIQKQSTVSNPIIITQTNISNISQSLESIRQLPQQTSQNPQTSKNQHGVLQNQKKSQFMNDEDIEKLKYQFYLDTILWNLSQSQGNCQIQLKFPQAQNPNTIYNFSCYLSSSLYKISQLICQRLGNQVNGCNAVFFNEKGLPLVDNIIQLHSRTLDDCWKLLNNKILIVILTRTSEKKEVKIFLKLFPNKGKDQILEENIKQNNQNNHIKNIMNQSVDYAVSYNQNFYMPWMAHFVKQNESGKRQFRTHSLVYYSHRYSSTYLHTLRQLTFNNASLVLATASLMENKVLSQNSRIAFEEGFLRLFFDFIVSSSQIPVSFKINKIFNYSRYWINYIIQISNQYKRYLTQVIETFKVINIDQKCQVTDQNIIIPAYLKLNKNDEIFKWKIVDYETIKKKQQYKEDTYQNGKLFSELELIFDLSLIEQYEIVQGLRKEHIVWLSIEEFKIQLPNIQIHNDWHLNQEKQSLDCLKIYSVAELKSYPFPPVLTKNEQKEFVIYTRKNTDFFKSLTIFDPMNGIEESKNPDAIIYQSSQLELLRKSFLQDFDELFLKQITQMAIKPAEAIVVLIDISSQINQEFYLNDLARLSVVKAFFNALVDKKIPYKLKHVIQLIFFNERYLLECDQKELFMQFWDQVKKAKDQGMPPIQIASENANFLLLEFKKKNPNCILRVITLTDGVDIRRHQNFQQIAEIMVQNNIQLDSFVFDHQCGELKQITTAVQINLQ